MWEETSRFQPFFTRFSPCCSTRKRCARPIPLLRVTARNSERHASPFAPCAPGHTARMEQGKFRRLVSPSSIWTCATGQAHKAQGIQNRRESTPGGEHQPLDRYRRKLYREGLESPTTPKTLSNPDHKPPPDHHYPQQELAESNPKSLLLKPPQMMRPTLRTRAGIK